VADYGCGVTSCEIDFSDSRVTWKNFGSETDYLDDLVQTERQRKFRLDFERKEYESVFGRYIK